MVRFAMTLNSWYVFLLLKNNNHSMQDEYLDLVNEKDEVIGKKL